MDRIGITEAIPPLQSDALARVGEDRMDPKVLHVGERAQINGRQTNNAGLVRRGLGSTSYLHT